MATLSIEGLTRIYPPAFTITDAALTVPDGQIGALVGAVGSGKSSLLRMIVGLDRPTAGQVVVGGVDVTRSPSHLREIGIVFRENALFPHMDVRGNVGFGLRSARWKRAAINERVDAVIELLALGDVPRKISRLTPEQHRRVAIARAIAPRPRVLLLDDPLGGADDSHKPALRGELREVLRAIGTTVLLATSDLRDAAEIADHLALLDGGRVLQSGPSFEVMRYPFTAEIAALLGYITLVYGDMRRGEVSERGVGSVVVPEGAPEMGRTRVMAHPSSLIAVPAARGLGSGLRGVVVAARADGPLPILEVALGERHASVRWEWDPEPPPLGSVVDIAVSPEYLRFYGNVPPPRPAGASQPDDEAESEPDEEPAASVANSE